MLKMTIYVFFFFTYNGHTLVPKDASQLKNGDINLGNDIGVDLQTP